MIRRKRSPVVRPKLVAVGSAKMIAAGWPRISTARRIDEAGLATQIKRRIFTRSSPQPRIPAHPPLPSCALHGSLKPAIALKSATTTPACLPRLARLRIQDHQVPLPCA
jgi:hypothetical protein